MGAVSTIYLKVQRLSRNFATQFFLVKSVKTLYMNILLLGSGGRECTLAWKLRQSALCDELYIAPGNAGTLQFGTNVDIAATDFDSVKKICIEKNIEVLFPGNEDPLVAGIYDFVKNDPELRHIIVAGPSKAGAQLEGSKSFSKKFMQRHSIPTAQYAEFTKENYAAGQDYIKNHSLPIVLKADGLAAGKGVIIAQTTEEALQVFQEMIQEGAFGEASNTVIIESFLEGIELSVFAFTDGEHFLILPEAKDYKRIGVGDTGPNTGGMGAVSPLPFADEAFMQQVVERIVEPTVKGLKSEGLFYQGFIFFGLIKTKNGPEVIEYNCRLGDPETEVIIPRLKNDLVELILHMEAKTLHQVRLQVDSSAAATVMLVSKGYPGTYEKGKEISGLEGVASMIFHAGTKKQEDKILSNGGRVLAVTSMGANLAEALKQSYHSIEKIHFEGKTFRTDIGNEFL